MHTEQDFFYQNNWNETTELNKNLMWNLGMFFIAWEVSYVIIFRRLQKIDFVRASLVGDRRGAQYFRLQIYFIFAVVYEFIPLKQIMIDNFVPVKDIYFLTLHHSFWNFGRRKIFWWRNAHFRFCGKFLSISFWNFVLMIKWFLFCEILQMTVVIV